MSNIKKDYEKVVQNVKTAAKKAGNDPESVEIVAVGKTFSKEIIEDAYQNGIRIFGENRVQELTEKYENLSKDIKWHMVGHLQRNKVKYIADFIELIHSLDSVRLAKRLNKYGEKVNRDIAVLVQVNISEEESKYGIDYKTTEEFLKSISDFPRVNVKGLMTIGPHTKDKSVIRDAFKKMNSLYIDIKQKNIDNIDMDILSMGMSYDYEIAVEEGSNMVRVGSAIFGKRSYK